MASDPFTDAELTMIFDYYEGRSKKVPNFPMNTDRWIATVKKLSRPTMQQQMDDVYESR